MSENQFLKRSKEERLDMYKKLYEDERLSWSVIAKRLGVDYPNKVRRDALRLGIKSRSKSEAQKVAIEENRHTHPTEGKTRTEATKQKISESQGKVWDNLTEKEREYRTEIGLESWNKKTDVEREAFFKKGALAMRESAKNGSKAEAYLFEELKKAGFIAEKHKEQMLQNEKFHLDLFIPAYRVAIEVDGPMHSEPIYGEEKLQRRQASDSIKNGLVLSSGLVLIRVKLDKRDSQRYLRELRDKVLKILEQVKTKFPPKNERLFEL